MMLVIGLRRLTIRARIVESFYFEAIFTQYKVKINTVSINNICTNFYYTSNSIRRSSFFVWNTIQLRHLTKIGREI
jgi:hypothetical protein